MLNEAAEFYAQNFLNEMLENDDLYKNLEFNKTSNLNNGKIIFRYESKLYKYKNGNSIFIDIDINYLRDLVKDIVLTENEKNEINNNIEKEINYPKIRNKLVEIFGKKINS